MGLGYCLDVHVGRGVRAAVRCLPLMKKIRCFTLVGILLYFISFF